MDIELSGLTRVESVVIEEVNDLDTGDIHLEIIKQ